jgi:hypothetical protein
VIEPDYPPAPSTPPEPAPPDPSLSTAARDPRSNDRRFMIQQGLDAVPGLRRLVKASTMPTGGSHTSLEDITCKNVPSILPSLATPPQNKHSSIHSISSCFYERGLGVDCLILSFTFLRNALDTLGISLVMQWQRKFRMGFIILLYLYHFSQCTHNALKVRPNQFFTTMHGSFVSLESNIL